jgi:YD repeat-containing protein
VNQSAHSRVERDEQGKGFFSSHAENGLTSYLYNDAGAVTRKTDARGIITDTSYGELGSVYCFTFSIPVPAGDGRGRHSPHTTSEARPPGSGDGVLFTASGGTSTHRGDAIIS